MTSDERIKRALEIAHNHGGTDGAHHKQWMIDQMVRALTGCAGKEVSSEYVQWAKDRMDGEDGPNTYDWDTGTPP